MTPPAKLIFMCGKMAAGKSTLSRQLAARENAVLLDQDHFLATLFPGAILNVSDYIEHSTRLNRALTPHICALLLKGISVVLDFPANTPRQRAWFRDMLDATNVPHELHLIEASDELCKAQLAARSKHLPPGTPWTTEADFDAVTAYFQPPSDSEGFNVIRHAAASRPM